MIGEKVKIELAARLIGAPDRRLQNRKWAKTDAITSAFAHGSSQNSVDSALIEPQNIIRFSVIYIN